MKHVLAALALAFAMVAVSSTARADRQGASCSFIEIEATIEPGKPVEIPAELKPLERKLRKPPFASWNRFTVKSRVTKQMAAQKPETIKLTNGSATAMLRDIVSSGKRPRYSVAITVDDGGGKRVVDTKINFTAGDYVVIGRSLDESRGHLLAQTCTP